jgi:anti-anti-sigma regulatory factor
MPLRESGGKIVLLNLHPQIRKVFEIIKALPSEQIFESVEELDQYLDTMQKGTIE